MNNDLKIRDVVIIARKGFFTTVEIKSMIQDGFIDTFGNAYTRNEVIQISPIKKGDILITDYGEKEVKYIFAASDFFGYPIFKYITVDSFRYELGNILGYKKIRKHGPFTISKTIITHIKGGPSKDYVKKR